MYKIVMDIDTDSDFSFEGMDIIDEYIDGTYSDALKRLIERIEIARETISCHSFDPYHIKNILEVRIREAEECLEKDWEFSSDFQWSNYSGDFNIQEVKIQKEGNLMKILSC